MPTPTYIPLANLTLSGSASSVSFSSISQSYKDLVLVVEASASTAADLYMRFNSDTSVYYQWQFMCNSGSMATAGGGASTDYSRSTVQSYMTTSEKTFSLFNISSYSSSSLNKSFTVRSNRAGQGVDAIAGVWTKTTAISSVMVYPNSGTFNAGSTFALYGIVG